MANWIEELMNVGLFCDVMIAYEELLGDTTPSGAVKCICNDFSDALADNDDAKLIYLAIAAAQLEAGCLLVSSKRKALEAIEQLRRSEHWIFGDADVMKILDAAEYEISNNKHKRKSQYVYKCDWKKDDVYVYELTGDVANRLGIHGHYAILRMESVFKDGSSIFPYCYFSISREAKIPVSKTDIENSVYLRDYRYVYKYLVTSYKKGEFEQLKYVGNFPNISAPMGEQSIPENLLGLYCSPLPIESIIERACQSYSAFVLNSTTK